MVVNMKVTFKIRKNKEKENKSLARRMKENIMTVSGRMVLCTGMEF